MMDSADQVQGFEGCQAVRCESDPRIEKLWAREAETRISAYEAGAERAVEADEVFEELDCE